MKFVSGSSPGRREEKFQTSGTAQGKMQLPQIRGTASRPVVLEERVSESVWAKAQQDINGAWEQVA